MAGKTLTIRLGELAIPLENFAKLRKQTQSQVARLAIAKLLKVENPIVELGNPDWNARRGTKE